MQSLGAADLLVLVVFVALVLDSRRLRALARSAVGGRRDSSADRGIPPGANPDQAGLPLRQIQMRLQIDWEDGGAGWDGPEILPAHESGDAPADAPVDAAPTPEAEPNRALPVLWRPFLPLLAGGDQPTSTTSSPTATRPRATTAA
ncbi:MAG: hypothetical protein AB1679_11515 [Actinomycetota bacterium]|jgi:hypothetical protein